MIIVFVEIDRLGLCIIYDCFRVIPRTKQPPRGVTSTSTTKLLRSLVEYIPKYYPHNIKQSLNETDTKTDVNPHLVTSP